MSFVLRSIALVFISLAMQSVCAAGLVNSDFGEAAGSWQDGAGPPGWSLNLGNDEQLGVVETLASSPTGGNAFRFSSVGRGFGDSRLEQCVTLSEITALRLSVLVMTDEPHPELSMRLRMDFYQDSLCDQDSANADLEQVQTDISLSSDRLPDGQWTWLESETRLGSELGADVASARISIRQRDRSDGGDPRNPPRTVWIDSAIIDAGDVVILPEKQRQALRDLYQTLDGSNWRYQLGWMDVPGTECAWQGVTCSPTGSSVVELDLSANALTGELPSSITNLDDLSLRSGLDLCWNDVLVPASIQEFVSDRHLGGDPGFCQGIEPERLQHAMSGHFFQLLGRNGEGIMLHMLGEGAAVIYWATHNDRGEPLWLTGTARGRDRILRFDDIWTTSRPDGVVVERAGRASLAFISDESQPPCASAILRFSLDGEHFGAADGRDLAALDGFGGCQRPYNQDPVIMSLEGHWFDPAQAGEGISLTPHGHEQVLINWFSYDPNGEQIWKIGAGVRVNDVIDFDRLIGFSGGSFNDFLSPGMLNFVPGGLAQLQRSVDSPDDWLFTYQADGEAPRTLSLTRIEAGPALLASTGRRIDLQMDPTDLAELYSRSIWSDERLPGTLRFDESPVNKHPVVLRFRGSSSRRMPKKSFNIRFENAQALLFGSDRMNLNAMYTDTALFREALSFQLFEALGHPAPRTRHFDLWINSIYEGTYTHIQRIDEWFLAMNKLNPGGTLIRDDVRSNPDLSTSSIFELDLSGLEPDERLELLKSNVSFRGDPDWFSLLELVEWVHDTPAGPSFQAGFEARFDSENFIDWLAIHWLIGDIDSFGDDYWLYLDSDDPNAQWVIIPWDKDLTFGSHWRDDGFDVANDWFAYEYSLEVAQQPGNALIGRFLATPALRQQATSRLLEMIEQQFTPAWFAERIEALAELLADSASIAAGATAFNVHPRNHHGARERYQDHIETMNEFVQLRQSFLVQRLTGPTGPIDQATAVIPAGSSDTVFLTDASGATLARIRPLQAVGQDISINVSVTEAAELQGINRRWSLGLDGDLPETELTLYYRNEISNAWGRGNWWTEGPEPVGRQDELQLSLSGPGGTATPTTRVNPYANLANAVIALEAGNHEITLELPN